MTLGSAVRVQQAALGMMGKHASDVYSMTKEAKTAKIAGRCPQCQGESQPTSIAGQLYCPGCRKDFKAMSDADNDAEALGLNEPV